MFQPGRFLGPFIFYLYRLRLHLLLRLRLSSIDLCHHIPSPSTSTLMSTQINMDFNQWLDDAGRTTYDFWEWHGCRLIGMGKVFVELFSAIINYLKSLHEVDQYNGKLLSTMRIRPISVGRKSSFMIDRPKNISSDQVVVMDGICKDIDDLRTMVGMVGIKFPQNPFPVVWDLFFNNLYDSPDFHHTTLRDVKKVALSISGQLAKAFQTWTLWFQRTKILRYELLFYPQYHLNQSSLLCRKPLFAKPVVMDVFQGYLLVTYRPFDVHIFHVKFSCELAPSSTPDLQLSPVGELSDMTAKSHPAAMRFIHDQLSREHVSKNQISTPSDLLGKETVRQSANKNQTSFPKRVFWCGGSCCKKNRWPTLADLFSAAGRSNGFPIRKDERSQSFDSKSFSFKEQNAHVTSVKNILESHASNLMSGKELSKLVAFVKGAQFDLLEYLQRKRYGSACLENFASGIKLIGEKVAVVEYCPHVA
ncbi:hypothetical protein ACSBR2_016624 [Camellia fascicularis]